MTGRLAAEIKQGDEACHASLHDLLTGLPNRALFNDRLEHGLAHAKRNNHSLVVMFIDLDDFKSIQADLGGLSRDDVLILLPMLASLPCSASTRR
jgi:diguanylate cyclase (GGDEF)-like protein